MTSNMTPPITAEASPLQTLELLARQIRGMETASRPDRQGISSGCTCMDRHLPLGGYARGSMIELIRSSGMPGSGMRGRDGSGSGVSSLALMIAKQAIDEGKYLVLVDAQRQFYPPAMQSLGIPLERVIALQPANHADLVWGMDQVLRCPAVGVVIAEVHNLEDRIARRWQLATEQGGGLGILLRDAHFARTQPSWADVQWQVNPSPFDLGGLTTSTTLAPNPPQIPATATAGQRGASDARWFELALTRCNGGRTGARIRIGIDACGQWLQLPTRIEARHEQASAMHLAAQLAQPTHRRRDLAG